MNFWDVTGNDFPWKLEKHVFPLEALCKLRKNK